MSIAQSWLKTYYLPISSECLEGCELCRFIGCRTLQGRETKAHWQRSIEKAISGGYREILLSPIAWVLPELDSVAEQIMASGLELRIRLNPLSLKFLMARAEMGERLKRYPKEWVIDSRPASLSLDSTGQWERLDDRWTIVALKPTQWARLLTGPLLAEHLKELRFYFPIAGQARDPEVFSSREVFKVHRQLENEFSELKVQPPSEYEIWEPRASSDLEFEPLAADYLKWQTGPAELEPKISVIIPTFNNADHLVVTLRHLARQDLPQEVFEIVVVDDGSNDGTESRVQVLSGEWSSSIALRYVYFPRPGARTMGDSQFRAGIARNLGVKAARGQLLAFLDSDVVVPKHYLREVISLHEGHSADVVQCVRLDLDRASSSLSTEYESINPFRDTIAFEGKYWTDFFSSPEWKDLPFFWKYTCTYGLSLTRKTFYELGRIRRTFVYYGFEDTELGYRLARSGRTFRINRTLTYHLYHRPERSEYANSMARRRLVLGKTARIFFHNHLDPEVYSHFQTFMHEPSVSGHP